MEEKNCEGEREKLERGRGSEFEGFTVKGLGRV